MAHSGAGHHVGHAVQKAVARTQDGDQHQLFAVNDLAGHGFERCFDLHDPAAACVARDFIGHQRGELAQQAAKAVGAGVFLAHQRELVLDEGMGDDGNVAHGFEACVCLIGRGGPVFSPAGALKMDAAQYQ